MTSCKALSNLAALSQLDVVDLVRVSDSYVEVLEQVYDDHDVTHRIPFDALESDGMSVTLAELVAEYETLVVALAEVDMDRETVRNWEDCLNALLRERDALASRVTEVERLQVRIDARLTERDPEGMVAAAREQTMLNNLVAKLPLLEQRVETAERRLVACEDPGDETRAKVTDTHRSIVEAMAAVRYQARMLIVSYVHHT